MPAREIPRDQWTAFFDSYSRRHDGWLSTVEVLRAGSAASVEVVDKPLVGIAAEQADGREAAISILLGGRSDDHIAHIVQAPVCVRVAETPEGADEGLDIETASGSTTRLRFRASVLAESLDGLVMGGP